MSADWNCACDGLFCSSDCCHLDPHMKRRQDLSRLDRHSGWEAPSPPSARGHHANYLTANLSPRMHPLSWELCSTKHDPVWLNCTGAQTLAKPQVFGRDKHEGLWNPSSRSSQQGKLETFQAREKSPLAWRCWRKLPEPMTKA